MDLTLTIDAETGEAVPADASREERERLGATITGEEQIRRAAIKEECRVAFQTGKATLGQLAVKHGVPYNTVMQWSSKEKWRTEALAIKQEANRAATEEIAEWLASKQVEQMKRAYTRAGIYQAKIDELMPTVEEPSELRELATVEEKMDTILRRNLNMANEASGAPAKVSVNILSGNLHLST